MGSRAVARPDCCHGGVPGLQGREAVLLLDRIELVRCVVPRADGCVEEGGGHGGAVRAHDGVLPRCWVFDIIVD